MNRQARDVILYELNEVPWDVVDIYVKNRPDSNLAALLKDGQSLTTIHEDREELQGLQPWRTWPTLHTSSYEHNSFDLGQDPSTFKGDPIWNVAERAGLSVGLFGPMQSWPARPFAHGGFYVPDTFASDAKTYPPALERFQAFNLAMTGENGFSPDSALSPKALAGTAVDLVRLGLTPRSTATLATHLVKERIDPRYKAFRSAMQAPLSFDLYWRQHRKNQPRLSVFFTNHVAGMMHRFWGDGMPGYTDKYEYDADEVYGSFIVAAMDITDRQVGRIRKYLAKNPQSMLVISASMGQGPVAVPKLDGGRFVLDDHSKLITALGLKPADVALAMYPMLSLVFESEADAAEAVAPLESVLVNGTDRLFARLRVEGKTVTFGIDYTVPGEDTTKLTIRPFGAAADTTVPANDLGLSVHSRIGGVNTGYHIPEGILLAAGAGITADPSRKEVDILDVAPSLLANALGVEPPPSMKGIPTLFG
ncbi:MULTISPECIES: hypothetical protein [Mycobacteriaceae]|uniref:Phosphodiesterase n=1 Tax=Mycolicibacterium neoaurum VKM Ac-1815D TaxID=700508 RepID=V5XJ00_MYCNE|nr:MULTISPECIES: hypothetical protein [Mycobacteriaceae]AHC27873.1 hypothetical protein D174_08235 [Mycolicibacterium neoaurum VKM Ac-1815D]AMO05149.1 hypothetical protein MyAD_08090 [Mycolicibacterium neoaurum]AXK76543.1 hypothetical protein DXK33_16995 [Mycolicibacterium neoaurum]KJQ49187.1 hypothetical protein TS71_16630 [Mycolicibacterium neoaurum]KUM08552.1 hypothetical protein AVZ31_11235 [Mycolicibacterium neoaurum]